MNRLTKKECYSYGELLFSFRNKLITQSEIDNALYNKLKLVEDTEEKLGIDFITLYEALTNGIRIYDDGSPYVDWVDLIYSSGIPYGFKGRVSDHCVYFKDFGTTWTLAKEV